LKARGDWEDLGVDGRIILRWILGSIKGGEFLDQQKYPAPWS